MLQQLQQQPGSQPQQQHHRCQGSKLQLHTPLTKDPTVAVGVGANRVFTTTRCQPLAATIG
jgi:hypothetical protein